MKPLAAGSIQKVFALGAIGSALCLAVVAMLSATVWPALLVPGVVLGGYGLAIGLEFVCLRRLQGAVNRTPLGRLARAWAAEVLRGPRVFGWSQPFRRFAIPDGLDIRDSNARGAVLVHGYFCNRAIWNGWMPRLRRAGIPHVAIDLEPAFAPIETYVDAVEEGVRKATEAADGRSPVLVAHSMGGLAVRAWLARDGEGNSGRVHRIFTIGSPHRGTWLARFARSANGRQMRVESPFLSALSSHEGPGSRSRFTCYWSDCDNVVFPGANATLDGADNRALVGWAHVHLVEHPDIFAAVLDATAEPDQMS